MEKTILIKEDNKPSRPILITNQILKLKAGAQTTILGVIGLKTFPSGSQFISVLRAHGNTSEIEHDGKGIFKNIPNPFKATRYHSLIAKTESLPDSLQLTARSIDDGEIMGIRHKEYPIMGIQFHPESILTEYGKQIIRNFLDTEVFP